MGELISTAWFSGPQPITIKLSTAELFHQAIDYFITGEHIGDYCPGLTSYTYLKDTSHNILTVVFS